MNHIDERLRSLDVLAVPDLSDEIERRARRGGPDHRPPSPPAHDVVRRVVVVAAALAVSVAALVLLVRAFDAGPRTRPVGPAGDPWAWVPDGWTELPPPPEHRDGAAWVWTGSAVLVWGGGPEGADAAVADGFAFDPRRREWGSIPAAPRAGSIARAVWTGQEAVFIGPSWTERRSEIAEWLVQVFDPSSNSWRIAPSPPIPPRLPAVVVWTGDELLVWGGGERSEPDVNRTGAAYDPRTDRWRRIADAPLGMNLASGVWTGDEMIVFGSLLNDKNWAETSTSVGAGYDPVTDGWRLLPSSELSPQATSAAWVGDRMVAWDYETKAQEYDPSADRWTPPVAMPLEFDECYPDSVAVRRKVFAWFCGRVALWEPATDGWTRVEGGPTDAMTRPDLRIPEFRFASFVAAGGVVVLEAEGITVDDEGVPCYGCPGAPVSSWVYRPPSDAA